MHGTVLRVFSVGADLHARLSMSQLQERQPKPGAQSNRAYGLPLRQERLSQKILRVCPERAEVRRAVPVPKLPQHGLTRPPLPVIMSLIHTIPIIITTDRLSLGGVDPVEKHLVVGAFYVLLPEGK